MSALFLLTFVAPTLKSPGRRSVTEPGTPREFLRKRFCGLLLAGLAAAGCGQVDRDASGASGAPPVGGTVLGAAGEPASQPDGAGGTSGSAAAPQVTCGTTSRQAQDPIVEICSSDQVCCSCGCGADDAACSQEQACPPPKGQRCGLDTCREGYVCCNAVCGVCAESRGACAATPGRCEAVGMDPAFERCSDVVLGAVTSKGFGALEGLLLELRGRWLVCAKPVDEPDDRPVVVAGVDFTSDGRFFLLARAQDEFSRIDTPETRGTLTIPELGRNEVDFVTDAGVIISVGLATADDPRGLWISGPPPLLKMESLSGGYLKDPNTLVE